jgi:hypothetical protein
MPKAAPKRPVRKKREIKDSAKQGTITRKEAREAVRRVSKNESSPR